jgi:gas vesicle protein
MKEYTMGKSAKRLALGAAVAGVAGYVAGLLTAPKSGKETRAELKQSGAASMNEVEKQLKILHTELGRLVEETKGKGDDMNDKAQKEFKKLVDAAKDSKEKLREVISAIHEGEAEDKDLSNALADAQRAIEHIKDYLKK